MILEIISEPEDYIIPIDDFSYDDINSIEVIEDIDGIAFYIVNDSIRVIADHHLAQVAICQEWIRNN